uniref:Putative secreted protein n=1 Tax=Anopheles darlingi TaxID=43151 RepID=A0A2M4DKT8_ANODA
MIELLVRNKTILLMCLCPSTNAEWGQTDYCNHPKWWRMICAPITFFASRHNRYAIKQNAVEALSPGKS